MMKRLKKQQQDLEGNSLLKAETIFKCYGHVVISDDSGLEVDALNGAPGVYSARYAGEPRNDQRNTEKLLYKLTRCVQSKGAIQNGDYPDESRKQLSI